MVISYGNSSRNASRSIQSVKRLEGAYRIAGNFIEIAFSCFVAHDAAVIVNAVFFCKVFGIAEIAQCERIFRRVIILKNKDAFLEIYFIISRINIIPEFVLKLKERAADAHAVNLDRIF
ncbi:hypothetical protein D3C72_1300130 [compost metagenome]